MIYKKTGKEIESRVDQSRRRGTDKEEWHLLEDTTHARSQEKEIERLGSNEAYFMIFCHPLVWLHVSQDAIKLRGFVLLRVIEFMDRGISATVVQSLL